MKNRWILWTLAPVLSGSAMVAQTTGQAGREPVPAEPIATESAVAQTGAPSQAAPTIPRPRHLWGDYDGDGLEDVFKLDPRGNLLLRNRGDGGFEDVTAIAFPGGAKAGRQGAWGEVNGDAYLDLVLSHERGLSLFLGEGGRSFRDAAAGLGLEAGTLAGRPQLLDYDRDGYADLLLETPRGDRIFRNRDGLSFEEIVLPGAALSAQVQPEALRELQPPSGETEAATALSLGDITAVHADSGLTGGALRGEAHLSIGAGDCIDVSADAVSVDVTDLKGAGMVESSNNLSVGAGDGIDVLATAVAVDVTDLLGAGLAESANNIHVGAGDGIDVSSSAVAVDVTDFVGSGLVESSNNLNVGAGDGIDVASSSISVDVSDLLGAGLSETSNNLQVAFAGTGASSTASRSDHDHDGAYTRVSESAIAGGTNRVMLTCDDNDDGILIRWGNETQENGVVFGQWANSSFSGIRVNNTGGVSVFHLTSSANVLDTGMFRLYYDEATNPDRVVLYNDGGDWCDYMYFKKTD